MNLEKLKDTARKHEQREEWRKAIEVYQRVLQAYESGEEAAPDLALYNKVGDLQRRVGDISAAVRSYERAVELYAEQGFSNNAIAVCGKILRDDPHRTKTYIQLARLHAKKNMAGEAKKHLIEYLERMNHGGHRDEAFRDLKEFADQFGGNDEIRVMLAELLRVASRTAEAQEQLEKLATELESRGDQAGAQRTRERMHEMEAGAPAPVEEPRRKNDLIFLDTGIDLPFAKPATPGRTSQPEVPPLEVSATPPEPADFPVGEITVSASDLMDVPLEIDPAEFDISPMEGLDRVSIDDLGDLTLLPVDPDLVADQTRLDASEAPPPLEGFEPTLDDDASAVPLVAADRTGLVSDLTIDLTSSAIEEPHPDRVEQEPLLGDLDLTVELGPTVESYAATSQPVWGTDDLAMQAPDTETAPPAPAPPEEASAEARLTALEDRVLDDPDNPEIHRALGEALLATGQHERGLEELDLALARYEELEDWDNAEGVAEELTRLEPSGIRYFQKLVELAYRGGQRARVIDTYLALGDALVRVGAVDKALAVYGRVAEQEPDNAHALAAIDALTPPAPPTPAAPPPAKASPAPPADDFVDLGALIQDDDRTVRPKDTRMRVQDEEPTGDEERDFAEMLKQFKRGLDENLDEEDFQSHYDLGVAFKEMGLLDEAISEFQKALRSPAGRMRTSEALGSSFFDKGQFAVAEAILRRAVDGLGGQDDEKIGLLYWLGRALEAEGRAQEAQPYYRRALAVDIHFMDLAERLRAITNGGAP